MTLLLAIQPSGGNWSPAAWASRFRAQLSDAAVKVAGADPYDPADIRHVAAWKAQPGLIASLPQLNVIFNLGAGVDALLQDATVPTHIPIVRVVDEDLTNRMTEYVVWQVLDQHRQGPRLRAAQTEARWIGPEQTAAKAMRVGFMGLGAVARDSADALGRLGFQVSGWSRQPKSLCGVKCFHGADGLTPFLSTTDILVVLLPLTAATTRIINRNLIRQLAHDGPLGRPVLINAGRGGLQVEGDIIACLDDGSLGAAVLDVFATEPLPAASPLWRHSSVTITPHNAADSDPELISTYVVDQIKAFERGEPLRHVVDRSLGY
jgi:glyoxylate/hydroxypyruvate reductase